MSALVWTTSRIGGSTELGTIERLPNGRMFSVGWAGGGGKRTDDPDYRPYMLNCYLPGFKQRPGPHGGRFATAEAAKAHAESMLARYASELAGAFGASVGPRPS